VVKLVTGFEELWFRGITISAILWKNLRDERAVRSRYRPQYFRPLGIAVAFQHLPIVGKKNVRGDWDGSKAMPGGTQSPGDLTN
jgi:hypothetical protein